LEGPPSLCVSKDAESTGVLPQTWRAWNDRRHTTAAHPHGRTITERRLGDIGATLSRHPEVSLEHSRPGPHKIARGSEIAVTGAPKGLLLEREHELASFEAMLDDVDAGEGRITLIEGNPGIGKTRLVQALRELAQSRGFRVLSARGGELERDFAFGLVRQLFEPALASMDDGRRRTALDGAASLTAPLFSTTQVGEMPADVYGILHGLYWLTANISDMGPLLLAVDDAHWSDAPSLRFVDYVIRRLEGLRVIVAVAFRPNEPGTDASAVAQLEQDAVVGILRPRGLSEDAVGVLIDNDLGWKPEDSLRRATFEATGGNPFLVTEVLAELRADGIVQSRAASTVEELGPERVARSVNARLSRLGEDASALARAVSVLGEADLDLAAKLAGIVPTTAAATADALVNARIFEKNEHVGFVHPVVRTSIYRAMTEPERIAAHSLAADLLADAGTEDESVAQHLLSSDPRGEDRVVDTLGRAARGALTRGAPDVAVRFLRRALKEPPKAELVGDLLVELGSAAGLSGAPDAVTILSEALEHTLDPPTRARVQLELGRTLLLETRFPEATAVLYQAIAGLTDSDRELRYELEGLLLVGTQGLASIRPILMDVLKRVQDEVAGGADVPKTLWAVLALENVMVGGTADEAASIAERALEADLLLNSAGPASPNLQLAMGALTLSGREVMAEEHAQRLLVAAQKLGSVRGYAAANVALGWVAWLSGELDQAEAYARAALEQNLPELLPLQLMGTATLMDVMYERGELDEASQIIDEASFTAEDEAFIMAQYMRESRSRLRLAQGKPNEALADAMAVAKVMEEWGAEESSLTIWRSRAAHAHSALGQEDEAQRLAAEQVEISRAFGAPRQLGMALTIAGTLRPDEKGLALIEEGVDVLSTSVARLEHARALAELASAHRRLGDRSRARDLMRTAMEEAHLCGATALVELARSELVAMGARPRRVAVTGRDSLTAAERRIAEAAASGLSNREIAQSFFVTTKTVETHMRAVFQKLGIRSRTQLPDALGADEKN
jgi:DNA-binding CsgD family transcriptional regulator/tetratricopeptide (TPR) repeat protein